MKVLAGTALMLAAAGAAGAAEVEIKHAVARVVVVPEARSDVDVQITGGQASGLPAIRIERTGGGKVILDGGLDRKIRGCRQIGAVAGGIVDPTNPPPNLTIDLRDHGRVKLSDAPLVTLRVPMAVDVEAGGAVFGSIARSDSVELAATGCGDWTVANTAGALRASVSGSGDVRAGTSRSLKASVAGAGDVRVVSTGPADVSIAGSGSVSVGRLDGDLKVSIAGSGDVRVGTGRVGRVNASIAGSGDVVVDAPVEAVEASVIGSGDVRVAAAGSVKKSIMGSGSVSVGR
jgi:hypothetical protein